MRIVWRDIADMNTLKKDNKLVTYKMVIIILGLPFPP